MGNTRYQIRLVIGYLPYFNNTHKYIPEAYLKLQNTAELMFAHIFLGRRLLKHNATYEKEIKIVASCSRTPSSRRVPAEFVFQWYMCCWQGRSEAIQAYSITNTTE